MNDLIPRNSPKRQNIPVTLATLVVVIGLSSPLLAQPQAAPATAQPVAAPLAADAESLAWTFGAAQPAGDKGWTAERGTITEGGGELRLQPDANRRVTLLSPSALPEAAQQAEVFVLGIGGTGLQRVRIQARRDARGGWITIADATGTALREVPGGYAIKRIAGARDAPIERLRIELQFRTTNPRTLQRIAAMPAPR
jgi:hypothetical protein